MSKNNDTCNPSTGNPREVDKELAVRFAASAGAHAARLLVEVEELERAVGREGLAVALLALGRTLVVLDLLAEDLEGVGAHLRACWRPG